MNRCITCCHSQFSCEDCPKSESYLKRSRRFTRVYVSIVSVIATVFFVLAFMEMNQVW